MTILSVRDVVVLSRPGMWGASMIGYCLALDRAPDLASPAFWLGLLYVTLPFNVLIMGWNDIVDHDVDAVNPRKGKGVWGAKLSKRQLDALPPVIVALNAPFAAALLYHDPQGGALVILDLLLASLCYNGTGAGWPMQMSRMEAVDLLGNIWIWMGALHVGAVVNGCGLDRARLALYTLGLVRSQLRGALCDLKADAKANKGTIATMAGKRGTLALIQLVWFLEGVLIYTAFQHTPIAVVYLLVGVGMALGAVRISSMYTYTTWILVWLVASELRAFQSAAVDQI